MAGSKAEAGVGVTVLDNLGCRSHCAIGRELADLLRADIEHGDEPAGSIAAEAQTILEKEPCEFIKDGNCRLANYLTEMAFASRVILVDNGVSFTETIEEHYGREEIPTE